MDTTTQNVLAFITSLAKDTIHPRKIILFGSRARGDAREMSDFDIAVDFDATLYQQYWSLFCLTVQEDAPTLLPIDLVNMNEIAPAFYDKIREEGIIVYRGE